MLDCKITKYFRFSYQVCVLLRHETFAEYADIHFIFGVAEGNASLSARLYKYFRLPHEAKPDLQLISFIYISINCSLHRN